MKKKFNNVYQFKISLNDIRPQIWRRIQVPESYTFYDLHVAIQDVMGWDDMHLHVFVLQNPHNKEKVEIGVPDNEGFGEKILEDSKENIADWIGLKMNKKIQYIYDFGDDWMHTITLEKILPREEGIQYPLCLAGKRACPPEDCGGFCGYLELLNTLDNQDDEEYEDAIEWVGEEFDPEYFDPEDVVFMDPKKRLESRM